MCKVSSQLGPWLAPSLAYTNHDASQPAHDGKQEVFQQKLANKNAAACAKVKAEGNVDRHQIPMLMARVICRSFGVESTRRVVRALKNLPF